MKYPKRLKAEFFKIHKGLTYPQMQEKTGIRFSTLQTYKNKGTYSDRVADWMENNGYKELAEKARAEYFADWKARRRKPKCKKERNKRELVIKIREKAKELDPCEKLAVYVVAQAVQDLGHKHDCSKEDFLTGTIATWCDFAHINHDNLMIKLYSDGLIEL